MTSKFSTLSKTTKSIVAAAVLGATLFASSGAQAAGNNFQGNFHLDLGNGFSFDINNGQQRRHYNKGKRHGNGNRYSCLNTRQAVQGMARMGYRNIRVIGGNNRFVKVKGTRHNNRFVMRINKCSGKMAVLERKKIRQHHNNNNKFRGNGFGGRVTLHY